MWDTGTLIYEYINTSILHTCPLESIWLQALPNMKSVVKFSVASSVTGAEGNIGVPAGTGLHTRPVNL